MSWNNRLQRLLRSLLGGGAPERRRIPDAFDYTSIWDAFEPVPAVEGGAPLASAGMGGLGREPDDQPAPAAAMPKIAMRRNAVFQAFNTAVPVSDRHGLAGRSKELARLVDAVVEQRKHSIIFGPRGSGKTSLARVFGDLADEAGCVALYGSAGSNADLDSLFRPFLAEMPTVQGEGLAAQAGSGPLDVQRLAALFAQAVSQRTLLILDEFDRVIGDRTKHEVAELLKLLSDMHAPVQIVLVGIAGNVDMLIAAHPSLRRHLYAQPVTPIEREDLAALLRLCASQAGMPFEEDAIDVVASAAIGSPFHARLFGMHAALAAEVSGQDEVTFSNAKTGLAEALSEWSDLTPDLQAVFYRALAEAGPERGMIGLAGVLAAQAPVLTFQRLAVAAGELFGPDLGNGAMVERTLSAIRPALTETGIPGEVQFEDSLSPQFLVLMANGVMGRGGPSMGRNDTNAARELLQGVLGR